MIRFYRSNTFWTIVGVIIGLISLIGLLKNSPQPLVELPSEQENKDQEELEKACGLYEVGKTDEAIKIIENLLRKHSHSVEVIQLFINCYSKKSDILNTRGKIKESIEILWEIFDRFPDRTIDILVKRLCSAKRVFEENRDYENAVECAKELFSVAKSIENRNEIVRLLNAWGQRYITVNNPFNALEKFQEANNIDPQNQPVINNLSYVYEWLGDIYSKSKKLYKIDLAIEKYGKAMLLSPKKSITMKIANLNLKKYLVYIKSKKYKEARESLEEVVFYYSELLHLDGESRRHIEAAETFLLSGLYKEAGAIFRELLAINPFAPYFCYKETFKTLVSYDKLRNQGPYPNDFYKTFGRVKKFAERKVDLNKTDLLELGYRLSISFDKAVEIIENMPYNDTSELLLRGIFERSEFNRVKKKISVQ